MSNNNVFPISSKAPKPKQPNFLARKVVAGFTGAVALAGLVTGVYKAAEYVFVPYTQTEGTPNEVDISGGHLTVTTTTEGSRFSRALGTVIERETAEGKAKITGSNGASGLAAEVVEAMGLDPTQPNIVAAKNDILASGSNGGVFDVQVVAANYNWHKGDNPASSLHVVGQ